MIVYVEWVILDNLALDLLLAYLCRITAGEKATWWRLLFSAVVGAALVFPFLYIKPVWARILYKVAVLVAVCLPLSASWKSLRKNLILYAAFSALMGGVVYLVGGTAVDLQYGVLSTSKGVVALVAASCLVALYLIRQVKGILTEIRHKRHLVKVELVQGGRFVFVRGFYDTGNTVVAKNGKGVVFLSPKIKDSIGDLPSAEDVDVRTILGYNRFRLYQIDCVKIYSDGQVNTINRVNVAYARDNLSGCDALLPCDL